jgi:hypothetical protein
MLWIEGHPCVRTLNGENAPSPEISAVSADEAQSSGLPKAPGGRNASSAKFIAVEVTCKTSSRAFIYGNNHQSIDIHLSSDVDILAALISILSINLIPVQSEHQPCGLNIPLYDHCSIDHYRFPRDQNEQQPFNNPGASFTSSVRWQWSTRFAYGIHICSSINRACIESFRTVDHAILAQLRQVNLQPTIFAYTQNKLPNLWHLELFIWRL